jgi:hypothetical protein
MNTIKLLKLAPTMIMAAVMAYAAYSINPQMPPVSMSSPASTPPASKDANLPDPGTHQVRNATTAGLRRGRNPFVVLARPGQEKKTGAELAAGLGAREDPYLALVQGLILNATFVQGKTQYASINGRLYERGQHLEGPGDETSFLVVTQVTPAEVVLEANGSRYRLRYPDQLTTPVDQPAAARTGRRDPRAASWNRPATTSFRQASRSRLP